MIGPSVLSLYESTNQIAELSHLKGITLGCSIHIHLHVSSTPTLPYHHPHSPTSQMYGGQNMGVVCVRNVGSTHCQAREGQHQSCVVGTQSVQ